jgi:hypothetical protein
MWLKYKHKHAWGIDKEWSWRELGGSAKDAEADAKEVLHELSEEHNWSDKYRGIDYEIVEYPPVIIIEEEILCAERTVEHWRKQIMRLKKMLKSAGIFEVQNS